MQRLMRCEITSDLGSISEDEKLAIYDTCTKYITGDFADVWTFDKFFIDPWLWVPETEKHGDWNDDTLDQLRALELDLILELGSRPKAIQKMVADGDVYLRHPDHVLSGIVQVGRDNSNALLIYEILIEISEECPNLLIDLVDDGNVLICPVRIQNGLVQPNVGSIIEELRTATQRGMLCEYSPVEFSARNQITIPEGLSDAVKMECGLLGMITAKEVIQKINRKLRVLKDVQDAIRPLCKFELYRESVEKCWFEPGVLVRKQ